MYLILSYVVYAKLGSITIISSRIFWVVFNGGVIGTQTI